MNLSPWIIGFLVILSAIGYISRYIPGIGGEDNPIEEVIEDIIKQQSNYDIDLSPSTPEGK